jgi:uncharacterized membrane protein YgaE (UPF0421/DUF939 family)
MAISDRLQKAKERLNAYYEAETTVLTGQEYRIGSRTLRRADLQEIRKAIHELEKLCDELESAVAGKGRRKAYRIIPRDL